MLDNTWHDPRLGLLKLGLLLARSQPEKTDTAIQCTSLEEVAGVYGIDPNRTLHETALQLLRNFIKDLENAKSL